MVEENIYKLKKLLNELRNIKGRHTELVTVYIPAGAALIETVNQLRNEQGTAENIKSKSTRKNVVDALERILQYLKLYKQNPPNGLALFCGNVSETEGQTDLRIWVVEPPEELKAKRYWCDQRFVLEPLEDMVAEKELFGLVILDTKEATIGLLKGKKIEVLRKMDSLVFGKFGKGGQCCPSDTLVFTADGNITKIENVKDGTNIKAADFNTFSILDSPVLDVFKTDKSLVYEIITKYPRLMMESSKDHFFFVYENGEVIEKPAEELIPGDILLMPEKVDVKGDIKKLNTEFNIYRSKITLPHELNEKLSKIIGYFLGDGNYDDNRIVFSEGNKKLATYYKKEIEKLFNIYVGYRFRKNKNYYELKAYSKTLVEFLKSEIMSDKKSLSCLIPSKILTSNDKILASFLNGFFDAEGYVSNYLALGINNKSLAQQVQMTLLRFGILSSLLEYDNRRNPYSKKHRFTVVITEKDSMKIFGKSIGFSLKEKNKKLSKLTETLSERSNVRQVLVSGKIVRSDLERYGYNKQDFNVAGTYLLGRRNISKKVFKKQFLDKVLEDSLYNDLLQVYNCNILPVKIDKIRKYVKNTKMIDLAVKHQSFIANGIFVHNSQRRFERVREGLINDWFKEIAENIKGLIPAGVKGIILGGPGPAKNDFYDGSYLQQNIKAQILGIKNIGYTDEQGLEELVERSEDLLAEAAVSKEKALVQRFFENLQKSTGMVTYGLENVKGALEAGAVDMIIISDGIEEKTIDELKELGKQYGTALEIISRDTREGEQLFQLNGIGAFLRWKIK